jgi:hypothetical protein
MRKNRLTKARQDILIFMFTFVLFVSLLFTSVKSQKDAFQEKVSWVYQMGALWIVVLVAGGALIFTGIIVGRGHPRLRKYSILSGLALIFIGTAAVEIIYLFPLIFKEPAITYVNCKEASIEMGKINNVPYTVGCILTGYVPKGGGEGGGGTYTLISFIIFGVILPATLFIYLFYDAIDFVGNKSVRNVLSFVAGLMAFRGAAETLFIEFLTYGMLGMGLLLFNLFFLMILYGRIKKIWEAAEAISEVISAKKWEVYGAYRDQLDRVKREIEEASKIIADPNVPEDEKVKAKKRLESAEKARKYLEDKLEKFKHEI